MKIKEGYILDEIGDQKVAISLKCGENDFSEMIKLNEIGAFLWEKLSEEIEVLQKPLKKMVFWNGE